MVAQDLGYASLKPEQLQIVAGELFGGGVLYTHRLRVRRALIAFHGQLGISVQSDWTATIVAEIQTH